MLQAGDCVLQPPGIRHRVLESSSGLEVVELASPAEHETIMDPDTTLPSANTLWERSFDGQTFVHHRAEDAAWTPSRRDGFEVRDTGIAGAAAGRGGVRVVRASEDAPRAGSLELAHDGELLFYFVLSGEAVAAMGKLEPEHVGPGDALTTPASTALRLSDWRRGLELLEIALPAASGAF